MKKITIEEMTKLYDDNCFRNKDAEGYVFEMHPKDYSIEEVYAARDAGFTAIHGAVEEYLFHKYIREGYFDFYAICDEPGYAELKLIDIKRGISVSCDKNLYASEIAEATKA